MASYVITVHVDVDESEFEGESRGEVERAVMATLQSMAREAFVGARSVSWTVLDSVEADTLKSVEAFREYELSEARRHGRPVTA